MLRPLRGFGRRLGGNAARVLRLVGARNALGPARGEEGEGGLWLLLRVGPQLGEQRPSISVGRERGLAFVDLLRSIETASRDPRVEGAVLRFRGTPLGWSEAASLRRAIAGLRAAGKRVWAWSEALDAVHYYAASAAERVLLPPSGALHLVGLRAQQLFFRDGLERLGVHPEVVRIGSHKGAAEPFTRTSMSPEQREQIEAFQADVFEELVSAIAEARGLDVEVVRRAIDEGPYAAQHAAERGLVDACIYPDEIEAELPGGDEAGSEPPLLDVTSYFGLHAADAGWRPLLRELPRVAYVVARGSILRGRSVRGIASQTYAEILARLRLDEGVRGVVLRVDSPGGDAVASDLIHRAVERLAAEKPVVVSMAGVAASGGYYLSAGASAILAEATTLTGSIGVVGGKLDLSGLYRKLGVTTDAVESGERAGLLSETRGFTPDERRSLQRGMESLYETFVDRVAKGRGLDTRAVERAAQGRIFSGERAQSLGLVDAIGGPLEALAEVYQRAGLGAQAGVLLEVHPRRPAFADLRALLGGAASSQYAAASQRWGRRVGLE